MQIAGQQGDIKALLSLMIEGGNLSEDDYIERSIGNLRYLYYFFLDRLHTRPVDMTDLVDGILYLDATGFIKEQELNRLKRSKK